MKNGLDLGMVFLHKIFFAKIAPELTNVHCYKKTVSWNKAFY